MIGGLEDPVSADGGERKGGTVAVGCNQMGGNVGNGETEQEGGVAGR